MFYFIFFDSFKHLTYEYQIGNRIGDEGMIELAKTIENNEHLHELWLGCMDYLSFLLFFFEIINSKLANHIAAEGIKLLSQALSKSHHLRALYLAGFFLMLSKFYSQNKNKFKIFNRK